MNTKDHWWNSSKRISIVVDNDEWMLPYADELVMEINKGNNDACLCKNYNEIKNGEIAFFLSCHQIANNTVLSKNKRNLVVHASNLPSGRGWSPLTWQILDEENDIPICLLDVAEKVDSGDIIYKDIIRLSGHELLNELRGAIAKTSLDLCLRFLGEEQEPIGIEQEGSSSYYKRRNPDDSELDINKSILEQFNLLRIVDNKLYPAFFNYKDHKYIIKIKKDTDSE